MLKTDELANADPRIPRFCVTNGHLAYERVVRDAFADPATLRLFAARPVIFLLRHPCDIAVSWYIQFTKRISPAKRELINASLAQPVDHERVSLWDFVRHPEIGLACVIDFMNQWEPIVRALERHLVIRYEELREHPAETLRGVVSFAGMALGDADIDEAVHFGSFENLQKLERSGFFKQGGMSLRKVRDGQSFKVRRGKIQGYRDDFTPEQLSQLDALLAQTLSPTLGYGTGVARAAEVRA
jgi:hypothetical protein